MSDEERAEFDFSETICEEIFVEEVRKFRCLWDSSYRAYRETEKKHQAWSETSSKLGKGGPLNESTILANEPAEFQKKLLEWLPRTGKWRICWRATEHGWAASTFHARCDGKIPSLVIVKVVKDDKNLIFGGYSTQTWAGSDYTSAPESFLFSLRNNDDISPFKAPLKDENDVYAIWRNYGHGPVFGRNFDMYITNNARWNTKSYAHLDGSYQSPPGYTSGDTKTKDLFGGSDRFTPSEIEVLFLN